MNAVLSVIIIILIVALIVVSWFTSETINEHKFCNELTTQTHESCMEVTELSHNAEIESLKAQHRYELLELGLADAKELEKKLEKATKSNKLRRELFSVAEEANENHKNAADWLAEYVKELEAENMALIQDYAELERDKGRITVRNEEFTFLPQHANNFKVYLQSTSDTYKEDGFKSLIHYYTTIQMDNADLPKSDNSGSSWIMVTVQSKSELELIVNSLPHLDNVQCVDTRHFIWEA